MNIDRIKITLKLIALRIRFAVARVVQLAGFAVLALGVYRLFVAPDQPLPLIPQGDALLAFGMMGGGAALVWFTSRTRSAKVPRELRS
jgi:hypothetical protein